MGSYLKEVSRMIGNFQSNSKIIYANAAEHEHLRAVTYTRQRADVLRPIFPKSCSVVESEHSSESFLKSIKALNIGTTEEFRIFARSTKLYFLAKISIGSEGIFCWKYLSDPIRPFQILATGQLIHFSHAAEKAIDKSSRVYAETIKQARAYATYIRKLSVRFMQKMDCSILVVRRITVCGGDQTIG